MEGVKMESVFKEIKLTEIRPNPENPRRVFEGARFDEMVKSVRAAGVIEPVLVRPVQEAGGCTGCEFKRALANKTKGVKIPGGPGKCTRPDGLCEKAGAAACGFELIAGERRWRASVAVAGENGGPENHFIPAIVRDVDDETAFDLMTIENLQRENLSELEEAKSFKAWVGRKGMDRIGELAERCGISVRYIRRRIAVLDLPEEALSAWEKGEIKYGHLEQLLRVKDDPEELAGFIEEASGGWLTVSDMRAEIDSMGRSLSDAVFDTETAGCNGCTDNSETQKTLFGLEGGGARCRNGACYKEQVREHLLQFWDDISNDAGTNGMRFYEELGGYDKWFRMHDDIPADCQDCENFVSIFWENGSRCAEMACVGPAACYMEKKHPGKGSNAGAPAKDGKKSGPRVVWHGTFFRECFYQEALPVKFGEIPADDARIRRLALFMFIQENREIGAWFCERHSRKKKIHPWEAHGKKLYEVICEIPEEDLAEEIKTAAIEAAMRTNFSGVESRHALSELAGVDLAAEWRITEEYLQKKTKAEILKLGEKKYNDGPALFETAEAKRFIERAFQAGRFSLLKKPELIRVFMESGVDLAGLVPDEVLRADKYNPSCSLGG
jgi:ParB family chromosome partitioning protein